MVSYERLSELHNRLGAVWYVMLNRQDKKDIREAIAELLRQKAPPNEKALKTRVMRSLSQAGITVGQAKQMSDKELLGTVDGIGKAGVRLIREM